MEDKLINIEDMNRLFKKRIWIICLIVILTTLAGIYKAKQMAPSYTASMKFLVSTNEQIVNYYSEAEIKQYTDCMSTFVEVLKVGGYLDDTLDKHHISKDSSQIKYGISYSASTTAPIFTLYYTSYDNNEMEDILAAVYDKFSDEIEEIIPEAQITILEEASVVSSLPNKVKVILVAFMAGLIVSVGIVLFLDYIDDTISRKEELEKIIPVPVLGSVPHHERNFEREAKRNVYSK